MTTTTDSPRRLLRLTRLLGRGGFGEVYEGEIRTTTGLSRRVAVKRLRKDLADGDDALLRLRDEASLLSQLRHPVVVSVEDLIPLDGHMTLISEYVEGVDLSAACPMPPRAALEAISKVAQALAAAWGQRGPTGEPLRIVHRDIKPANIRLGPHGVVKLLDFGIARTDAVTRVAKTGTGLMVGSMGYMAPERWKGEPDAHAGDIFALGCVLFEALSGQQLYGGMSAPAQVGLAVSAERFQAFLDERLTALPAETRKAERLLRAMLAHTPDDRPTGAEVADRTLSLAGRVRGDSLLAWSRTLDELPPPSEENRVDSSWIEGPSGFSRVSPASDSGVATLEHPRPEMRTGTTVRMSRTGTVGVLAGVGGLLVLGVVALAVVGAGLGLAFYADLVPGFGGAAANPATASGSAEPQSGAAGGDGALVARGTGVVGGGAADGAGVADGGQSGSSAAGSRSAGSASAAGGSSGASGGVDALGSATGGAARWTSTGGSASTAGDGAAGGGSAGGREAGTALTGGAAGGTSSGGSAGGSAGGTSIGGAASGTSAGGTGGGASTGGLAGGAASGTSAGGTGGGTSTGGLAGGAASGTSTGGTGGGTSTGGSAGDATGGTSAGGATGGATGGTSTGGATGGATGGTSTGGATGGTSTGGSAGGTSTVGVTGGSAGGTSTGGAAGGTSTGGTPPPAPVRSSPAAAPAATIAVTGHRAVRLKGPGGLSEPGTVPPGTYTVQVSFDAGVWTDALTLQAKAGQAITVRCDARFRQCRTVTP